MSIFNSKHFLMATAAALTILVVLVIFTVSCVTAASETPFVVAHKKASVIKLKSGSERVSVNIDIYNHGSLAIYDVSLTDDSWSSKVFDFAAENTSRSWERLDAGTHVSHSFELESKVKTTYYSAPAVITFRIPTKSELQQAYSTPIPPLETFAEKAAADKLDLAKKLLAQYGSHVSVFLLIVLFVRIVSSPSKSSPAKKKN